ncbi:hypothetical protein SLE2022_143430 [Rubroshorea leprosula]
MEIDLELPSLEQEKSDPVTNKNVNILEAEVGVGVNDGYVDSPKTCEHAREDEGKENATACENDVDFINVGTDVLRKGAVFEPKNDKPSNWLNKEGKTLSAHGFLDVEEENHSNSTAKSSKGKKIHKKRKDLGSRASIPDGYYGSQQNMQGVRHLNANSPVRDGYCGSPQTLLALGQLSFRAPNMHSCFDIPGSLQDVDRSLDSTHFHGIASKNVHEKDLSQ